ncbi:MAG: phage portal protein [Elusimicrobia bacterium]|nr:phage portal protein [Elusimicrobiota bacterium]
MKNASAQQVDRNREYLAARAKNPDLAHSDLVPEGDIEFMQISVPQKDMEFLDLREFTRNEILAVYGVPPGKVSIIETGNIGAGTGEHQTQTFYEETILPFQMRVAEKLTKHVVRQGFGIADWSFQFNKRAIDEKDQAEIFNIYLQNGVFTPEEVRRIVAPRMPELQKSLDAGKGALSGPSETIVNATAAAIAIENRFVDAMGRLFRDIKAAVAAKLPSLDIAALRPKATKAGQPPEPRTISRRLYSLRLTRFPEASKQLDDIEVLLEYVDKDKITRVLQKFTLEAAAKGLKLSAQRGGLDEVDEPSQALQEKLKTNAVTLAGHVSESLKAGIRQALIEGITANETIPELMRRIETQLDSVATVQVGATVDENGNVLRGAHTRKLDRSTASEIIARTEANRAFNEGALDALGQAGVERVQWLLASDACPECVAAAEISPGEKLGRIMALDEASDVLPAHPNCRCAWVTVLEEK